MKRRVLILAAPLLLVLTMVVGCQDADDPTTVATPPGESEPNLTFLALGDSYTAGHALPPQWSWPCQVADSLAAGGDTLQAFRVIAETAWTTRDLLNAIRTAEPANPPDGFGLVTLMIGVNNQFQHVELEVFAAEMDTLIALALELAGDDPHRILGFSIPDYGVTPVGQLFNAETIAVEVQEHNAVLLEKYDAAQIMMLDVTELSLAAATNPDLVSRDGLHYSQEMYRLWVQMMLPEIRHCLGLDTASASPR